MSKAIVIGGGIIGLFTAYYLHKSGWSVEILEQGDLSDNCSYGNAGMITPSHFVPLASPGMVEQGVRWMFNSKSPFYVKPSLDVDLLKWGLKFVKSASKKHVDRSAGALRDISLYSKTLFQQFAQDAGFDFGYEDKGILLLFKTPKMEDEERHLAEQATNLGLDAQYLTPAECKSLQPNVSLDVLGAVHYHCDAHLYPNRLMAGMIKYLEDVGVIIRRHTQVTKINHTANVVVSVSTYDNEIYGDAYIVAGGSWSPQIAKMADLNIPLMPGKGYSFMVNDPVESMTIPSILCEARVAVTPMAKSIRFGGTMEIGKINDKINLNLVKGIVESVPRYFPSFKLAVPQAKDIWFGFRPVSPDGLPYIGMSGRYRNMAIATGHAMIGLSLAPATGKLIADAFNGEKSAVDASLFSPVRYQ